MRLFILVILISCTTLFGNRVAAQAQNPVPVQRKWKVDGVERSALVYIPPQSTATTPVKMPLLFAFHGHGGTMQYAVTKFRYHKIWPEAIVVYMQGLPTPGALTDPEGKKNGWQKSAGDQKDRDLKFFDAVLASLKQEYPVNEKEIYVTGHSNGGGFTYLLWAERGDTFAAVAPAATVSGRSYPHLKPKPALQVAGEHDELVRFAAQKRMMEAVRKLNGCAEEGKPWAISGTLVGTLYPSKSGTPFVSVIYPGPHQFPDEASELIVKFFKEQCETRKSGNKETPKPSL